MPPRRGRHLPVADKTFLDDPQLVLFRPLPTANAIGGRENFDLRAVNEIGHNVGLIIGSQPKLDGPRRSLTLEATLHRYVWLYNQQLPQSALGSKTPLQAMKNWHKLKPELFKKQPYYLPGCDRLPASDAEARLDLRGGTHCRRYRLPAG